MPCPYITDAYAQEPLKYMVVSMSFHEDARWIDDRGFCPGSAAVAWISSASMRGVHDWLMHAIHA